MTTEWVLVPREPTANQLIDGGYEIPDPLSHRGEITARRVYSAMLDAAPAAPQMTDAEMIRTEAWQSITDELAHAAYLRGIEEGKRQAAAPQQVEPVAQIGWADEFGNLFPMGAWKPTQRTHHDSHKAAWRAVYLHPPAAPQQAEPVAWVRNLTDPQPHCVTGLQYRTAADADAGVQYIPVYLYPPAAEVQRLARRTDS